jgi:hypothetical protein
MSLNNYTSLHFNKKSASVSSIFHGHIEPMLLSLLILTGAVGSIYLFGHPTGDTSTMMESGFAPEGASISQFLLSSIEDEEEASTNQFDEFITIKNKPVASQDFMFDFIKDEKAARYVIEMGDGTRLIVTQKNLQYTYKLPGKYTMELKEINRGILTLIGTKKVKVK